MKKVFVTGYYGQSNFGDDLFQEAFYNHLKSNYKSLNVTNYAPNSKGKYARFKRVLNVVKNMAMSDVTIFAGGSVLSSRGSTKMKLLQYYISKILNKKIMAYGVSYGPFDDIDSKNFYHKFIKQLEYISLRDQYSYEEVLKIEGIKKENVHFTGDIASMIPEVYGYNNEENISRKILGISLCNYEKFTKDDYKEEKQFLKNIINDIKQEANRYDEIKIFALKTGELGDEELAEIQFDSFSEIHSNIEIIYHYNNVSKTLQALNSCSHLICMRLHAMIPALVLGKNVLAIEYHDKCKNFLDTINYPNELRIKRGDYGEKSYLDKLQNLLLDGDDSKDDMENYKLAYANNKNRIAFLDNN